ncbi:MAG: hypothetical protein SOY67_06460 [Collinsella sp.]|nr:hypothetical protein [Collinsella sp.]
MARTELPSLSDGNKLYLYDLLKREIGTGRQTFLPRVEEALATDRMTGKDLGFDDTRALMEALGEAVALTVFKGGRVYATLQPMPAWDEALAAAEAPKAAGGSGKPWKRKRGAKALKPQRPRRVKRDEDAGAAVDAVAGEEAADARTNPLTAEAVVVGDTPSEADVAVEATVVVEAAPKADVVADAAPAGTPADGADASEAAQVPVADDSTLQEAGAAEDADDGATAAAGASETPAIALTITYDPTTGRTGETVLVAEGVREGSRSAAAPQDGGAGADEPSAAPAQPERAADPTPDAAPRPEEPVRAAAAPIESNAARASARGGASGRTETRLAPGAEGLPTASRPTEPAPEARQDAPSPVNGPVTDSAPEDKRHPAPEPSQGADSHGSDPALSASPARESHVNAGEPGDASSPSAGKGADSRADAPRPVCPNTVPTRQALASYPRDFATEVHIPSALLAALTQIMPLHANVADELSRDFRAARGLGEVRGTRARAVFPLRFDGGGRAVAVAIKRTPQAMRPWAVNFIDRIEDTALAQVDIEGLPLVSPAEAAIRELAMRAYLDPEALDRLARAAWPAIWDADALRAQLAFALRETELAAGPLPTGLYTSEGSPLLAAFEATGEDIPWRLTGPAAD